MENWLTTIGEIGAAYCAGHIIAKEAIIIAYQRGTATVKSRQHGAMLAVGLSPVDVVEVIHNIPDIGIACYNAPDSVTLTGSEEAIDEARARLSVAGIFHRKLATSRNAYHSSFMEEAGGYYETFLKQSLPGGLKGSSNVKTAMFSSVTERIVEKIDLHYWRQNLESPVRFNTATQLLLKDRSEVKIVVEIGPHSALAGPIKAIQAALGYDSERLSYLPTLRRHANAVECVLNLAGFLFLSGHPLSVSDINAVTNTKDSPGVFIPDLPTYQWDYGQDVLWAESRLSTDIRFRTYPHHDLLGSRLPGTSDIAPTWRNLIALDSVPWLRDHKVGDAIVFPAAGYVALVLEAIAQTYEMNTASTASSYKLREMTISSAMLLKESENLELLTDLHSEPGGQNLYKFVISTISNGAWTEHASGSVQAGDDFFPSKYNRDSLVKKSMLTSIDGKLHYDPTVIVSRDGINKDSFDRGWYGAMDKVGLMYGEAFKTLSSIGVNVEYDQATAQVPYNASEKQMVQQSRYAVHPTALDACLQLSIIAAHKGKSLDLKKAYMPISISNLTVWPLKTSPNTTLQAFGRGESRGLRSIQAVTGLTTPDDQPFVRAEVSFLSLETSTEETNSGKAPQPYTRLVWKPEVDRLTSAQAAALFAQTKLDDSTANAHFSSLEELTQLAIRSVAERLPQDLQVELLPNHMQKFYRWITKQNSTITNKGLADLTGHKLEDRINSIVRNLEQEVSEAAMVAQLTSKMPRIVSSGIGALDVMLENNLLTRIYEDGFGQIGAYAKLKEFMALMVHKHPRLSILELGAGTGGATKIMLNALEWDSQLPKYERYSFTDVSKAFLGVAQERFQASSHLDFGILDIENEPTGQGFDENSFDVVFASNVSKATA
jgi:acyl transferase domain-containing protein